MEDSTTALMITSPEGFNAVLSAESKNFVCTFELVFVEQI